MIDSMKFALAGKAVFTLTRPDGKHFTYRVNKKCADQRGEAVWFVNLGIGYEDSIYLGMLGGPHPAGPTFRLTGASRMGVDTPSVLTFGQWWCDLLNEGESLIRFQHEGKCCVCGRPLTNPESIDAGIGPECASKG